MLSLYAASQWHVSLSPEIQENAIANLEKGHVLLFPHLDFRLSEEEKPLISTDYADPKAKNISYHLERHVLWGVQRLSDKKHQIFKAMMHRYALSSYQFIKALFPTYTQGLIIGRTSFRPLEIAHRKTSYRKDDKRLHVDAFPATPNQGRRILRIFTNVNPVGEPRIWRLGEPFESVVDQFLPQIAPPMRGLSYLLRALSVTKTYRTLYDHYMLQIHDRMKANEHYQKHAAQQEVVFPAHSSWIVETDHVSHAAMRGQYVFEQTFYLEPEVMQNPLLSPLKILERRLGKRLS